MKFLLLITRLSSGTTNGMLNLVTVICISLAIALFLGYGIDFYVRYRKIRRHLKQFNCEHLEGNGTPLSTVCLSYKEKCLKQDKTTEYASFFISPDDVYSAYRIRIKVVQAIPNILTSIGILGTFIGLSLAIMKFDAGTSDAIRVSIKTLLGGMSTAFLTSVAGMFLSSLFLLIERRLTGVIDLGVNNLCGELDMLYHIPVEEAISSTFSFDDDEGNVVSISESRRSMLDDLMQIKKAMSQFSSDLCDSIGEVMDTSFQEKLVPIINRLAEKLENPAQALTNSLVEEFRNICSEFSKGLTRDLDDQMNSLMERFVDASNSIQSLPETMELINSTLKVTTQDASQRQQSLSKDIDEQLLKLVDISDSLSDTLERLNTVNLQIAEAQGYISELPKVIGDATLSIQSAGENIEASNKEVSETFTTLAELNEETKNQLKGFIGNLQTVQNGLKGIFSEVNQGLTLYADTSRSGLQTMLDPFSTSVADASDKIANAIAPLSDAIDELQVFSDGISTTVKSFSSEINTFGKVINQLSKIQITLQQAVSNDEQKSIP